MKKKVVKVDLIRDEIERKLGDDALHVIPIHKPRQHWDKAFIEMHKMNEDQLLIDIVLDEKDWE